VSASIEVLKQKRKAGSQKARRMWRNPVYASKQHLAMLRSKDRKYIEMLRAEKPPGWSRRNPTYGELLLNWLTTDLVEFVGDGILWVDFRDARRKNPDFVVLGQNRVIEFLGDYWHKSFKQTDVERLIEMYWRVGIECLVIWGSDLISNRDAVIRLISRFIGEAK
jgi:hypothetical protein